MDNPYDSLNNDVKEALQNDNPALAVAKIQKYLDEQNNIPLNIAVTGESGSGKSTFVNAFRSVNDSDEGAAPTGCVETTMEVTPYPHPDYPSVTLWDLPGMGSAKFPADKYLEHVGFEKFDFFIIISATRFKENDLKLAQEIQKMGKKFYFVRSKIDNDVRAERRSQRNFNKQETLTKIRENCSEGLHADSPQVFLISGFNLKLYDFPLIHETLEKQLPSHKKHALLLAMPNVSLDIINKKKEAFQAKIIHYAFQSAARAAVPIPGLSVYLDVALLVDVLPQYVTGFGLDKKSLQRLADSSQVPLEDLTGVTNSPLVATGMTLDLVIELLRQHERTAALTPAESVCRFIPIIGIPLAMDLSFTTTYRTLSSFLDMLADDAHRVFKKALSAQCGTVQ